MSIYSVYTFGFIVYLCNLILPGAALLSLAERFGLLKAKRAPAVYLLINALGFYWCAVTFLPFLIFSVEAVGLWKYKLVLDILLAMASLTSSRSEILQNIDRMKEKTFLLFLLIGAIFGSYAFILYPHALDSGQLFIAQLYIFGRPPIGVSMAGYVGLATFSSSVLPDIPVVYIAGTFKVFLGALLSVLSLYAVDSLNIKHRFLGAALLFILIVLTMFGIHGVLERGKDSIFGVLFSFAFMVTLCRDDALQRSREAALYFAAAAITGIIAVPYMGVFYVLWVGVQYNRSEIWGSIKPLYWTLFGALPIAISGFSRNSFIQVLSVYAILGLLIYLFELGAKRIAVFPRFPSLNLKPIHIGLLVVLFALCVALMPVTLEIGSLARGTREAREPLNGITTFWSYGMRYPMQQWTVIVGIGAAILLLVAGEGIRRPGIFAFAVTPFAVMAAVLLRIHLQIPVIPNFHIWDLAKDTRMWYAGPIYSILIIFSLDRIGTLFPKKLAKDFVLVIPASVLIVLAIKGLSGENFDLPQEYTAIGGFSDQDQQASLEAAWHNLKNVPVFMDANTSIGRKNFHKIKFYGPNKSIRLDKLQDYSAESLPHRFGIVVQSAAFEEIRRLPQLQSLSIQKIASVEDGKTEIFIVTGQ